MTRIASRWTQRFSALPKRLTAKEVAARLGCKLRTAQYWAKRCGYKTDGSPWPARRRRKVERIWNRVDWTKSNAEIATKLKRTRESVRQMRMKMNGK